MRTSRMTTKPKKRKRKYTNLIIVMLVLGIAAYFVSAGAAGGWLAENVIEPVFNSDKANALPEDEAEVSTLQTEAAVTLPEVSGERIEEKISADKLSLYTLQVGAFSNADNANDAAKEITAKGGAGYVAYDGELYRVLIAGYTNKADADDVKSNLEKESIQSSVFILESGALEFIIGADESQVTAVKSCFDLVPESVDTLQQIVYDFDNGKDVRPQIASLQEIVTTTNNNLLNVVDTQDGEMQSLHAFMQDYSTIIQDLSRTASSVDADYSSQLKYNLISIVVRYSAFLDEISK